MKRLVWQTRRPHLSVLWTACNLFYLLSFTLAFCFLLSVHSDKNLKVCPIIISSECVRLCAPQSLLYCFQQRLLNYAFQSLIKWAARHHIYSCSFSLENVSRYVEKCLKKKKTLCVVPSFVTQLHFQIGVLKLQFVSFKKPMLYERQLVGAYAASNGDACYCNISSLN